MVLFDFHYHHQKRFGIYNLNIDQATPKFAFSVGIHPKDLDENGALYYFNRLKAISQSEYCVAIGECGLDSLVDVDQKLQEEYFQKQILWANEIKKPIIIHCVRQFGTLAKFKKMAKVPMIIHGFNKKKNIADEMLRYGFYLSFGNAVLHNVSLQQILKDWPIDQLFLESDDRNFDIDSLYEKTASLKDISKEKLLIQILKNYEAITTL